MCSASVARVVTYDPPNVFDGPNPKKAPSAKADEITVFRMVPKAGVLREKQCAIR